MARSLPRTWFDLVVLDDAEGVNVPARSVGSMISMLTSEGVLSRKAYHMLMAGLAVRNALAHGIAPDAMPDRAALRGLLALARNLGRSSVTAA